MKGKYKYFFLYSMILAVPVFANQNNLSWLVDNGDGFGSVSCCTVSTDANLGVVDIINYKDDIYAGTWRLDGAMVYHRPIGGGQWVDSSVGLDTQGFTVTSFCVNDGEIGDAPLGLYVGTWDNNGFDIEYFDGTQWHVITTTGFDLPSMQAATSMITYKGKLYVGVFRNAASGGTRIGHIWQDEMAVWHFDQVNEDGFGNSMNTDSTSMAVISHGGEEFLCAGTENRETGGNGTEIWCGSDQNGSFTWVQINEDGFDYAQGLDKNESSSLFAASDGSLYAGTNNMDTGAEVWRYTGDFTTWYDTAHWQKIMDNGFVNEYPQGRTLNYCIGLHAIEEFKGKLYFGTGKDQTINSSATMIEIMRALLDFSLQPVTEGAEIWSYADGVWTLEMENGLSNNNNYHINVIRKIGDDLWVGMQNTTRSQVIRSIECEVDEDCDDGQWCNGVETCVDNHCISGSDPCPDDGLFCDGKESCDEEGKQCVHSGNPCEDGNACTDNVCDEADAVCKFPCNATGSGDPCCQDSACMGEPICQGSRTPW